MIEKNIPGRFKEAYNKALLCHWKGGTQSISNHLKRRIKRGHLHREATEFDLIQKGLEVLQSPNSIVYFYVPLTTIYFVVFDKWAVFFDEDGLWDTTFPPDLPDRYFDSQKGYTFIGKLSDLDVL